MKSKRENLIEAFEEAIQMCPEYYPKIMSKEYFEASLSTYYDAHTENGHRFDCPSRRAKDTAYIKYVTERLEHFGMSDERTH